MIHWFPSNIAKFPSFLYVFLHSRGKNSLQMSKFPVNQVPERLLFLGMIVHVAQLSQLSSQTLVVKKE